MFLLLTKLLLWVIILSGSIPWQISCDSNPQLPVLFFIALELSAAPSPLLPERITPASHYRSLCLLAFRGLISLAKIPGLHFFLFIDSNPGGNCLYINVLVAIESIVPWRSLGAAFLFLSQAVILADSHKLMLLLTNSWEVPPLSGTTGLELKENVIGLHKFSSWTMPNLLPLLTQSLGIQQGHFQT